MAVTDATTLPRARVLEVTRRLDGAVTRLAIKVQLLATGEEKDIDDRGDGPITIAADVQAGDLITLTPSGPHTFQWTKSLDSTNHTTEAQEEAPHIHSRRHPVTTRRAAHTGHVPRPAVEGVRVREGGCGTAVLVVQGVDE